MLVLREAALTPPNFPACVAVEGVNATGPGGRNHGAGDRGCRSANGGHGDGPSRGRGRRRGVECGQAVLPAGRTGAPRHERPVGLFAARRHARRRALLRVPRARRLRVGCRFLGGSKRRRFDRHDSHHEGRPAESRGEGNDRLRRARSRRRRLRGPPLQSSLHQDLRRHHLGHRASRRERGRGTRLDAPRADGRPHRAARRARRPESVAAHPPQRARR